MQNMTESSKFSSLCQGSYKKEFSLRSISYQLCDFECEDWEIKTLKITIFFAIYWSQATSFWPKKAQKGSFILQFSFKINQYNKMFQLCDFYLPETENLEKRKNFF